MPSLSQRRIQNQLLTTLMQGYSNTSFIAPFLFPELKTKNELVEYVKFEKEFNIAQAAAFMSVGMGAQPSFIDFETSTATFSLKERAVGTKIYKREFAEANKILKLKENKSRLVKNTMDLFIEKMVADMAQATANYTNFNTLDNSGVGKYKWSHASAAPLDNIQTAVDAIRTAIGNNPDTLTMGYTSAVQLSKIPEIQMLVWGTLGSGINVTPMQAVAKVAEVFGIKYFAIGEGQYATTPTSAFSDLWTDTCNIAYVGKDTLGQSTTQNFGCLFRKDKYPEIQEEIIPLSDQTLALMIRDLFEPQFINETAGYLINDTV